MRLEYAIYKSPGPASFTTEFYKAFKSSLSPILVAVYNDSFRVVHLPPTLTEASISLILKKDKDPMLCGSYRTIPLLNVDLKILYKILSIHIQKVLQSLILQGQTGFCPGRWV